MGKFTGLLLASDYDNTLTYTEEALRLCQPMPPVPDANQEAIRYFMSEGGIFSVATGRAKPAFERVAADVPMNGPHHPVQRRGHLRLPRRKIPV